MLLVINITKLMRPWEIHIIKITFAHWHILSKDWLDRTDVCLIHSYVYHFSFMQNPPTHLSNMKNPCWKSPNGNKLQCLPYFYLAGIPKCGTTDLYDRISLHPQVNVCLSVCLSVCLLFYLSISPSLCVIVFLPCISLVFLKVNVWCLDLLW